MTNKDARNKRGQYVYKKGDKTIKFPVKRKYTEADVRAICEQAGIPFEEFMRRFYEGK